MRPGILLTSRGFGHYGIALAVVAAVCWFGSEYALKLRMAAVNPAVLVSVPEIAALLLAGLGTMLLRPRMWTIDRLGTPGRRWLPATVAAVFVIAGPLLVIGLAAAADMPPDTVPATVTTVLFLTAVIVAVSPYAGPLQAGMGSLLLYLATALIVQLLPAIGAWSPIQVTTWPAPTPLPVWKSAMAAAVTVVALGVTVRTRGCTARVWSRNLGPAA